MFVLQQLEGGEVMETDSRPTEAIIAQDRKRIEQPPLFAQLKAIRALPEIAAADRRPRGG